METNCGLKQLIKVNCEPTENEESYHITAEILLCRGMVGPDMPLQGVFAIGTIGANGASIRLFSSVSENVSPQVIFFRGGVKAMGAQEWSLSNVSTHVFHHASSDTCGVRTMGALVCLAGAAALLPRSLGSSLVSHLTITVQPHL